MKCEEILGPERTGPDKKVQYFRHARTNPNRIPMATFEQGEKEAAQLSDWQWNAGAVANFKISGAPAETDQTYEAKNSVAT